MIRGVVTVVFAFSLSLVVLAQDAQWRGPNRDGIFPATGLLDVWPEEGPEVLFVTGGLGKSFSSAVATEDMIYVTGIIDSQNHGVVLLDGYLYGSNFTGRNSGKWVCMNWNSGEIIWVEPWFNKGPIIAADGMLYCYDEKRGNMGLVKADPEGFEVISSFRVAEGSGPHWARPSIYNRMLLVRHGKVLIAYKIS